MKTLISFCTISLMLILQTSSSSLRQQKLIKFEEKLQAMAASNPAQLVFPTLPSKKEGRVFYPIGYGADPSGVQESSDAILNALGEAFKVQNGSELLPGVNDLGGVVIDLQGGNYKISKPIIFPASGGGNVVVKGGTLRASNTFPGDRHLIELWSPDSQPLEETDSKNPHNLINIKQQNNVGIFYEDIIFRDILFDSSFRGGGILVVDSVRIRIDSCFFLHFTTQGVLVKRGHETFISNCFLGQHSTIGRDKGEKAFSGTGIDIDGNDNAITNSVMFSSSIGILLKGQANLVTGVHCYNKAAAFGGIGILVKLGASLNRLDNCYLDFTTITLEDPIQVHVTNGLFFGGASVVLKSVNGRISGVNIVDNMFNGDPENMYPIVKLDGVFTSIDQVLIDRNHANNGMTLKSTIGNLRVTGNGTKWTADFSSVLVFPNRISHFQYSFYVTDVAAAGLVMHAVTNVSNNVVVVESNKAVNAIVSVFVDQYNRFGESKFLV